MRASRLRSVRTVDRSQCVSAKGETRDANFKKKSASQPRLWESGARTVTDERAETFRPVGLFSISVCSRHSLMASDYAGRTNGRSQIGTKDARCLKGKRRV